MGDSWRAVPLGDLCSIQARLVDPTLPEYQDLPHVGIERIESGSGRLLPLATAAEDGVTSGKYLFTANDVIYSKIRPELRKAAFPKFPGLASADAYPLRVGEQCLPEFLHLLLLSPTFSEAAMAKSGRTKMPKINRGELFSIPVLLPSLPEQARITDLIGALDAEVEALVAEATAVADMEGPLIEALVVSGVDGFRTLPLGEVGEFIRGRRFTKEEYVPTGLGCIHYGQVHTHFRPVARQSLTFLPEELRPRLRLARKGDVVVAATSEDVVGLGKATVGLGDDDVAVHDDCYIFRHSLDPKFASYVFLSPWFQHQKRQYASVTKVTRISGSNLAKIEIPIPAMTVQARIGETLSEVSAHVDAVGAELDSLRRVRASLMTALLSQCFEIPESYDLLLDRAVAAHLVTS